VLLEICIWQISHKKATIAASITTKAEGFFCVKTIQKDKI